MERYEQYIGKTLNGKYTVKELLGVGGMAYVFKATVIDTGETVSVKILNEESSRDEKSVTRFVNESKAVSMLSHQNIVKIYDVVIEKDINYLVMEYVDGITLKEYIDFKKQIDWGESVFYVSQILRALDHAHSRGIIHRDIKPQNIMITRDGVIKVMDFGIAKLLKSESITMTDMALGTVDYISPEQASGKKIGFYSDIYSVGVMLYEMTTGKLPFIAESPMAVAMMQIQDEPTPPGDVNPALPKGLEQIILKSMQKEPDDRFSSCASMEKALQMVSDDPAVIFTERHKAVEKKSNSDDKKKKINSFLPVISGVTLAFVVVMVASVILVAGKLLPFINTEDLTIKTDTNEIKIPKITGEIFDEDFVAKMEKEGFRIVAGTKKIEHDPETEVGQIVSQSPKAGETRIFDPDKDIVITVDVNPAPVIFMLDNYANMKSSEVVLILKRHNVKFKTVNEEHKTVIKDYVIKTEPGPGTVIDSKDDITVKLYVSSGAPVETVKVPRVTGMALDAAIHKLQEAGVSIESVDYEESDATEGTVISQSLAEGEQAYRHISRISLSVSRGKSEDVPPEDKAEPDPSTEPSDEQEPDDGADSSDDNQEETVPDSEADTADGAETETESDGDTKTETEDDPESDAQSVEV